MEGQGEKMNKNKERFYAEYAYLNGYMCIIDRESEDCPIWIDCNEDFIPVIIEALNNYIPKKL